MKGPQDLRRPYQDDELADAAAYSAEMLRSLANRWLLRIQAGRLGTHPAAEAQALVKSLHSAAELIEANPEEPVQVPPVLEESDERFRMLVDSVRDYAIYMVDADGRIASWNAGAERIMGYRAEEILGKSLAAFYPPEELASGALDEELATATREGRYSAEGVRLRKNGERFWAHVTLTAFRRADGRLLGFAKVTRDITEQRAAAEALRQSEERMRLMVAAVRDYAIFMLDPQGQVVSWNAGAERIKGYTADEVIGKHFSTFYTEADRARNHPANELAIALETGSYSEEGWRVRKDGSLFWATVLITTLRDRAGRHVGFAKVTRDLTEQRRAEDLLRQSEERLRLLVESVKDYAIFMLDPDGRIASWNGGAQHIKGYTAQEIIGQHFSIFYPPEDVVAGRPQRELEVAVVDGRYEEEGWRVRKNGERFWANVILTSVYDRTGTLRGFAKVTRDLTDRRRIEEEARRAAELAGMERARAEEAELAIRSREEFISVAAHELRTPLMALQLNLEGTVRALARPENPERPVDQRDRLDRALRQVYRLTELVERLLDVSRIVAGNLEVNREPTDLSAVVRRVVDDFKDEAASTRTEVRLHDGEPTVGAWDPARIEQVVTNLMSNALKYGGGKPIDVHVERKDAVARLTITDRGIGIAAKDVERIFAPFERAVPAKNYGGLGLGLYVARNILELHGGTIRVTSEPGVGTTFVVELPISATG